MADFMYQKLRKGAWQFYVELPEHVQYSWRLMKHALLKCYVGSNLPRKNSLYFCGTYEECIRLWIMQVEKEMTRLEIQDDMPKANYASQGLSHDGFVFLHMLPEDWRHSWTALEVSLLMRYWRLPKPLDSVESYVEIAFESLQDEF
ncbi:hypothetical protein GOP47_0029254 [Adiantum capillus-veneris]|nr:hypothetical protein GOP47_0029254 [Adiantum capillus-veneris]